jgi:hypothetical protein
MCRGTVFLGGVRECPAKKLCFGGDIMPDNVENVSIVDSVAKSIGRVINENASLRGHFSISHVRNGVEIDHREVDNLITTVGKAAMSGLLLVDVGGTAFDYIALGIGTTAAAAGNTTLESEIVTAGGQRKTGTGTQTTTTTTNDSAQLVATFSFTGTFAVTESGVLNAASDGTLLCRAVFAAINVVSGDSVSFTWKVVVS